MDDRKVVYFSHPMSHYDTEFEWDCIETILHMLTPEGVDPTEGYLSIMNPNQLWLSNLYTARLESGDEDPFEIFREVARACDIVVGVTFFDGAIGAGVAEECRVAIESGKEVYLIFMHDGRKLFIPCADINNHRILDRDETRARKENGEM